MDVIVVDIPQPSAPYRLRLSLKPGPHNLGIEAEGKQPEIAALFHWLADTLPPGSNVPQITPLP